MSQQPRCDECPPSAWLPHRSYEERFNDVLERLILVFIVVPTALVQLLSDDFNGRLSSPLFLRWHVEIIDEDDAFLIAWTVHAFGYPVELGVDDLLGLRALCLRGETNLDG